jgi:hypothetical protein
MNELNCPICFDSYSEGRIPLILPQCGHTICSHCATQIQCNSAQQLITCPIDRKVLRHFDSSRDDFLGFLPKNFALFDIIQRKKDTLNLKKMSLCSLHDKPKKFVCMRDFKILCVGCLSGDDHIGHKYEELKDEYKKSRIRFKSLLSKYEEIQRLSFRVQQNLEQLAKTGVKRVHSRIEVEVDEFFDKIVREINEELEHLRRAIKRKLMKISGERFEKMIPQNSMFTHAKELLEKIGAELLNYQEEFGKPDFNSKKLLSDLIERDGSLKKAFEEASHNLEASKNHCLRLLKGTISNFTYIFQKERVKDALNSLIIVYQDNEGLQAQPQDYRNFSGSRVHQSTRCLNAAAFYYNNPNYNSFICLKKVGRGTKAVRLDFKNLKRVVLSRNSSRAFTKKFSFVSIPKSEVSDFSLSNHLSVDDPIMEEFRR